MRAWISWICTSTDRRPLTYPPNRQILGWWCTGYAPSGESMLVALVECGDVNDAATAIYADWPEARLAVEEWGWRFADLKPDNYVPNDRFPLSEWMMDRVGSGR